MDKRLLEIFLELVSIDGLSANERLVANYITAFLERIKFTPTEDLCAKISDGNTGNIICPIGTGGNFVLLSHMDTARSTKDVKPQLLIDRITSDGNTVLGVDNRAGIASLLFALEKLVNENKPVKDFTLAFTIQEETTLNGSANIELNNNIKMAFVFDSHLPPGDFIYMSAGSIGFSIKVYGKASHSGLAPEKGIDSIKIASVAISKLEFGRIDSDTTANIGIIKGGTATNVIPELTTIEGEVRSMIHSNIDKKIEEIKTQFELTAKEFGGKIEFDSYWNFKPYKIAEDSETFKTVVNAISKIGLKANPNTSKGGSDANSLNAKGISCVNLGIGAENPHSNDEFILYKDLENSAKIAMELMQK